MMSKTQLNALLGLTVVLWAVVLIFQHQPVSVQMLTPFSYVLTGLSFCLLLWDRWLWRWYIFRGWFNKRPDLLGTWKGVVHSNWSDDETKQGRGPIDVYLVIRQTYTTIDVRLFSEESSSVSLSGNIFNDAVGVCTLAVAYRNTPRILKRGRSPINHGGMLLSLVGKPVHKLDGEYWTDRGTMGEITLTTRSKATAHDFEEAAKQKFR
jgi:SMODS-associating 2TM, beta-strand rich effector domain